MASSQCCVFPLLLCISLSCDGNRAYGGKGQLSCIPNTPWDGYGTCDLLPENVTAPPYTMPPTFNETIDEMQECIDFFRDLESHTAHPTPSKPQRIPSIEPTIAPTSPTTPSPLATTTRGLKLSASASMEVRKPGNDPSMIPSETLSPNITVRFGLLVMKGGIMVDSEPATDVDSPSGSATLNGHVLFPADTLVTYYFEYGTDCSFEEDAITTTPLFDIVATGSQQSVPPQTITGLKGNYCYRLLAVGGISSDTLTKKLALVRTRHPLRAQRELFQWVYGASHQFHITQNP